MGSVTDGCEGDEGAARAASADRPVGEIRCRWGSILSSEEGRLAAFHFSVSDQGKSMEKEGEPVEEEGSPEDDLVWTTLTQPSLSNVDPLHGIRPVGSTS